MNDALNQFAISHGLTLLNEVANRRGSLLWRVLRGDRAFALKGCESGVDDTYDRHQLLRRESAILRELGPLIGNQHVESGEDARFGPWLLMRWIEGETLGTISKAVRAQERPQTVSKLLPLFISISRSYGEIHAAGYLHGDVQMQHVVFEPGAALPLILDWGLGHRADNSSFCYRGGFIHYAAPEIAGGMLKREEAIRYTLSAEIYSLGALFRLAFTGDTAIDYGPGALPAIRFDDKLRAVAENRVRPFPDPCCDAEAGLQEIIARCLRADSGERFSSAQRVETALREVPQYLAK